MNQLISVIIPVHNGDRYLSEAIESILAQNYHPIEILVIDDGSTDNTAQVAIHFHNHINYIYQPNQGAPSARNVGLKMATGNAIAFLDADDIWSKTKLAFQIDLLDRNPLVDIVLGHQQIIYLNKNVDRKPQFENYSTAELALQLGTALFRKSVFDRVGLFDRDFHYSDDWDWFMRARELGVSMMIHPDPVLFYRRHDLNMTNKKELNDSYTFKMLKKSIDRRRQQNHGVAIPLPQLSNFQVESNDN